MNDPALSCEPLSLGPRRSVVNGQTWKSMNEYDYTMPEMKKPPTKQRLVQCTLMENSACHAREYVAIFTDRLVRLTPVESKMRLQFNLPNGDYNKPPYFQQLHQMILMGCFVDDGQRVIPKLTGVYNSGPTSSLRAPYEVGGIGIHKAAFQSHQSRAKWRSIVRPEFKVETDENN